MVKLVNRAKMTVASGGAGNITLGTAVAGYQTFADAGVSDTDTLRYTIEDGDDYEIGTGVYTASGTTLVRTVTESSNSNAALTCSADAIIFVTLAAEDFSGNVAPIWTTTPPSTLDLANDGSTAVTLAGVAIDEWPVRYSWDGYSGTSLYDADSLPPQLASAPTFSGGTASLVGSSTESNAGSFNFRLKASDGVKTATAITAVNLSFFPQTNNLFGKWDFGDTASYSGSGSTWSDLSGNGRDLTVENGAYSSSGYSSTPAWVWTSSDAKIDLPDNLSTVKTYMMIWGFTGSNNTQGLINGNDNSLLAGFVGPFTGAASVQGLSTHSGESISTTVNGNSITTANDALTALEVDKLNMFVVRGAQMPASTTTTTYADYPTFGSTNYNYPHQLRALIMWTVSLTESEIKQVYDLFPSGSMADWDGS